MRRISPLLMGLVSAAFGAIATSPVAQPAVLNPRPSLTAAGVIFYNAPGKKRRRYKAAMRHKAVTNSKRARRKAGL